MSLLSTKQPLQYGLLLKREMQSILRDSRTMLLRLMLVVGFALVTGGVYLSVPEDFDQRRNCFVMMAMIPIFTGNSLWNWTLLFTPISTPTFSFSLSVDRNGIAVGRVPTAKVAISTGALVECV